MKKASEYKELTNNKSLFYTLQYEETHPVIMHKIEESIMDAVSRGQYFTTLDMVMMSAYDVKMINKVLQHYGFTSDWFNTDGTDEFYKNATLNIHWA